MTVHHCHTCPVGTARTRPHNLIAKAIYLVARKFLVEADYDGTSLSVYVSILDAMLNPT